MIFSFSCMGGVVEALSRPTEKTWTVHDAQLSRRSFSPFEEVGRFVVATRGALTPTPQMVSPPGDLFIRHDD